MVSAVKRFLLAMVLVACGGSSSAPATTPTSSATTTTPAPTTGFYSFTAPDIDGQTVKLDRYKGKVVLVVNTASKCGFTPQYEGLEALYKKHQAEGLVVLGFPSDQFGHQEPGTESEIKTFCLTRYALTFPLFAKVDVNGPNAHPLYKFLRAEQPGKLEKDTPGAEKLYAHLEKSTPDVLGTDAVKWNFTKFLVDRNGKVVKRFESPTKPDDLEPELAPLLAAATTH